MNKLYIVSRDGKSINDFISLHGLDKSKIKVVKLASDLNNADGKRYVILPPLPISYHWSIRPLLSSKKMINVTRLYTKRESI